MQFINGVVINSNEKLQENLITPNGEIKEYTYLKINGVKYYYDDKDESENKGKWFSIMNGERYYTDEKFTTQNGSGVKYYIEADVFTSKILYDKYYDENGVLQTDGYNLQNLTGADARDGEGNPIYEKDENGNDITNQPKFGTYKIFDTSNIEYPESNFNQQRLAVIRYSIEKNLSIAIANYNNYSGVTTNFQMPKLKEDEWEKILNNVSIISFMQGLNIGGKVYNGYSIIINNKNKEVVSEDSIYILASDGKYHRPNDKELLNKSTSNSIGVLNIDFEIKSSVTTNGNTIYYMPKVGYGSYSSIVTQISVEATNNLYKYMVETYGTLKDDLKRAYFTALGRERYGMYRTNNNVEEMKKKFLVE